MADNKRAIYKIEVNAEQGIANLRRLDGTMAALGLDVKAVRKEFGNFATEINEQQYKSFISNTKKASNSLHGTSAASGSATASVLEMGRTISDSNYGIRGMANNLSQLASNMVYTTKAAGGLGAGLKQIWKAMMGPLGLILVFQAAIAWLEKMSMNTDKVAKSLNKLADASITATTVKLELLKDTLNDTSVSLKAKNELLTAANKEYPELNLKLDENNQLTETSNNLLTSQTEALMRNAKAKAIASVIEEEYKKQATLTAKSYTENLEWYDQIWVGLIGNINKAAGASKEAEIGFKRQGEAITESEKIIEKLKNMLTTEDEDGGMLLSLLFGGGKNDKKKSTERLRKFKTSLFDLEKEIVGFIKREEDAITYSETIKLQNAQLAERDLLRIKYESFVEKEKLRLKDYLAVEKNEERIKSAKEKTEKALLDAEKEYGFAVETLRVTQAVETSRKLEEIAQKEFLAVQKARRGGEEQQASFAVSNDSGVDAVMQEYALEETKLKNKLFFIEQEKKARIKAGESIADLEQDKANAVNASEQEQFELKRKLEAAKLDVVAQGLEFVKDVAGEGTAVGKAAAVAMTTMSTYEAATAALGAKPYGPWNIAQAAIVTAMGLSNVQKILSTKTPGDKGGSASAPSGRTFDFNLVGSTGVNQLAQTVGGQVSQPIKAYVVGSEITNQQAFDNQIQGQATIG